MLLVWKPTKVQKVCIRELDRQALIAMVLLECTGVRCLPLVERGGPPGGKRGSQLGWPELMGEGRGDEPVHTQPKTHTCQ